MGMTVGMGMGMGMTVGVIMNGGLMIRLTGDHLGDPHVLVI
jgi:hypothetical protein